MSLIPRVVNRRSAVRLTATAEPRTNPGLDHSLLRVTEDLHELWNVSANASADAHVNAGEFGQRISCRARTSEKPGATTTATAPRSTMHHLSSKILRWCAKTLVAALHGQCSAFEVTVTRVNATRSGTPTCSCTPTSSPLPLSHPRADGGGCTRRSHRRLHLRPPSPSRMSAELVGSARGTKGIRGLNLHQGVHTSHSARCAIVSGE